MEKTINYWLHRCKCGNHAWPFTYELLEKHNIISIGWSDFSKNNDYQKHLTESWDSFEKVFIDEGWGLPRNRHNLWRFLNGMKQGDIVVVPLDGGLFSIYRIADNVVYNNQTIDPTLWKDWNGNVAQLDKDGYPGYSDGEANYQIDMGFYRKVEPLGLHIPRSKYAEQALYSRMKIQTTNAAINDIKDLVDKALNDFNASKPINFKQAIIDAAAENVLKEMRTKLNDIKMEELVCWYMEQLGATTYIPPKNGLTTEEGDADVVATFDKLNDFTILVQVKAHKDDTNEWAVEQIKSYYQTKSNEFNNKSVQLWVISSCDKFSDEAVRLAQEYNVNLVNGLQFAQMLVEIGIYTLPM